MTTAFDDPPQLRYEVFATRRQRADDTVTYLGEVLAPGAVQAAEAFTDRIKLDLLDNIVVQGEHRPYPVSADDRFQVQAWRADA